MRLSPRDIDKLMLHNAAFLAQKRYARGLKLNYPETIALISGQILEFIREGYTVAELMDKGKKILGVDDVIPGVEEMVDEVQVEGTFPDGTKLVTVHHPVCNEKLDGSLALYGSGLSVPSQKLEVDNSVNDTVGKYFLEEGEIILNEDRKTIEINVHNSGDRPIQVGSHYAFAETNIALKFDRAKAIGYRLNIPAGTAVRFEPGEIKAISLVEVAGEKVIYGGNALIDGAVTPERKEAIIEKMIAEGFLKS